MRKKLLGVLSVTLCVVMLVACGQKKPGTEGDKKQSEKSEQSEEKFKDRESVDLGAFKVYYPEGWKYDEENMQKEEKCSVVNFFDGEARDNSEHTVYIEAAKEDAYRFRKTIVAFDVELKDYAEEKMETVSIGNAKYTAMPENNSGSNTYKYRYEASGTSYTIRVQGGAEDDSVKELLDGIILEQKDEGLKDAPWPWEGSPVQPELKEQMAGTYTIVPEYIPFEEPQGVMQIMDHKFVKQGNQIFHLQENKLDTYECTGNELKFVSSLKLDEDFEYLSADKEGMLYLSPGIWTVIGVKDGQKAMQTTITGDLAMHTSGAWGISFWANSDTQKITNQGGNLTSESWILTDLNDDASRKGPFSLLDDVEVTDDHIMVAGKVATEDGNTKIVVYDYDGNQLLELGGTEISDPDSLGAITGMVETENGFVAIDGNMREIQFWAKDGTHIGAISTEDIFGVGYPWLEDMQLSDDGSILILLTQEREDGSADELMLFRLTGF